MRRDAARFSCAGIGTAAPGCVALGRSDGGIWLFWEGGLRAVEHVHDGVVRGAQAVVELDRLVSIGWDDEIVVQRISDEAILARYPPVVRDVHHSVPPIFEAILTPNPDSLTAGGAVEKYRPRAVLSLSADGRRAFAAAGRQAAVVDVATCRLIARMHCATASAISPDGLLVGELATDHAVGLLTADEGLPAGGLGRRSGERLWYALAWAPDGRRIAVSGYEKYTMRDDRESIYIVSFDNPWVESLVWGFEEFLWLAWSPDGAYLGWAAADAVIGIVSLANREAVTLQSLDAPVIGLGFWSSERFVAATADGEVIGWHVPTAMNRRTRGKACAVLRPADPG